MTKEVRRWTDQSEDMLEDALENADWEMFCLTSTDVSKFMEVVVSYISLLTDTIILTVQIKIFPNQKPWVDETVRSALRARTTTYNAGLISGDMLEYKAVAYGLQKTIKEAKRWYRDKVEADFKKGNTASVWKGLQTITDFKSQ